MFVGAKPEPEPAPDTGPFDAFAGGYPVPPMPGQVLLPELQDVIPSTAEPQRPVGEEQ